MRYFHLTLIGIALACIGGGAVAQQAVPDGAATATATAAGYSAAVAKAVNLCSTCHGPYGVSVSPEFPNLAAQNANYLAAQLKAFREHARAEKLAHDFMWGIAGPLDNEAIAGLAKYYSEQKPAAPRPGNPALVPKGQELFDKGVPDRGILACTTCHGANAQGSFDFPRLAGQNATYVVRQLEAIQSAARAAPVMHGIVQNLSPEEMVAVAEFVQSK
jgi:cytochrome c553